MIFMRTERVPSPAEPFPEPEERARARPDAGLRREHRELREKPGGPDNPANLARLPRARHVQEEETLEKKKPLIRNRRDQRPIAYTCILLFREHR